MSLRDFQLKILDRLLFAASSSLTSQENIYREHISSNIRDSLRDVYPACERVVGTEYFYQMCWDFCKLYPPTSFDLNYYGEDFSSYISELIDRREEAKDLLYLPDLAKLEWLVNRCSFANIETKVEGIYYNSSLVFFESEYPIHLIWDSHFRDTIDISSSPVKLLIWKYERKVYVARVSDEGQWEFLKQRKIDSKSLFFKKALSKGWVFNSN